MDVLRQFLTFFQDYLDLCQSDRWPEKDTTYTEIQNAFIMSQHIDNCMEKLQRKNLINEFLSVLNDKDTSPKNNLKNYLSDPPKCILKKIVISDVKTELVETAFSVFIEVFTEDKLEKCLADIMVEAASQQTLLKYVPSLPKEEILKLKSKLLLNELEHNTDGTVILDMLRKPDQNNIELLISCILNKDPLYIKSLSIIKNEFRNIMLSKSSDAQCFWKCFVKTKDSLFTSMLYENNDLFKLLVKALLDNSKLIKESMSAECFYIDLAYSEICSVTRKICQNKCLNLEFFEILKECQTNLLFWESMLI